MIHTHLPVDDFPDFILEGFADVRRATGHYPVELWVNGILAEMMGVAGGIWRPTTDPGVWAWAKFFDAEDSAGIDEFGLRE